MLLQHPIPSQIRKLPEQGEFRCIGVNRVATDNQQEEYSGFHSARESPNDPKLSDRALAAPQSEGTIRAVRCSAWLGDIGLLDMRRAKGKRSGSAASGLASMG